MSAAPPRLLLPLSRLLVISRPALWVNTIGTLVTGVWLTGRLYTLDGGVLALLLYLTLPFNLLIYGLNDLADREEDARSSRKGGWQGARLRPEEEGPLRRSTLLLNAPLLLGLAMWLPPAATATLLLAAALFVGYSLPPLRFKARPFLDGLSNVAYALPLALPALALGAPVPWAPLLALMSYSVGKHAFDAAQDIPADRAAGTRTVATTLGTRGVAAYALAWFTLAGALLWPVSRLTALALWLTCGGMALALLRRPAPEQAGRLYPLSIVTPWIVGSVAGVQLVYLLARGQWDGL
ncbi:UbiA family prenyltransferase [Deinococcus radiodurans]|jgi:lycopene elongase|nr:UbiA family prenyltransferase [Deinococcus radiodurans]ANC71977.1 prenyltransferase [Deinococcus radiodurans R1 = ATCC 13939 = DSM 20539]QIP28935.1 UbiA family prenyltransferase [Deinococcus radiodurans]QIP32356.1 UbiA family prenyltransferase [Deinococcus radiodurans]UID69805.1 prenyltransferase [Deinococcus radiodurans R1 = ATCC 13939 = DSM 20539]UTA50366.1 UbiA family prenyltransferase [Deinococcus radiodurans]